MLPRASGMQTSRIERREAKQEKTVAEARLDPWPRHTQILCGSLELRPPSGKLGMGPIPRFTRLFAVQNALQPHEDIRGAGRTMHRVIANGGAVLAQIGIG